MQARRAQTRRATATWRFIYEARMRTELRDAPPPTRRRRNIFVSAKPATRFSRCCFRPPPFSAYHLMRQTFVLSFRRFAAKVRICAQPREYFTTSRLLQRPRLNQMRYGDSHGENTIRNFSRRHHAAAPSRLNAPRASRSTTRAR